VGVDDLPAGHGIAAFTFGRLGDLRGHKRVYLAGLMVFVPASVLCGISPSVRMLIAARVLQGIGAAIVVSTAPAILIGNVHPSRMGQMLGLQAAMTSVGLALGPSLGGWLTDQWGWRTIFFMNVPIGGDRLRDRSPAHSGGEKPIAAEETFDRIGALLFLAAFLALQVALSRGTTGDGSRRRPSASSPAAPLLDTCSCGRKRPSRLRCCTWPSFRNRLFSLSVGSALVNYLCMASVLFLVPFYLIQGEGFSRQRRG